MLQETVCVRETASQGQQFDHLLQVLIKKEKETADLPFRT